MIRSFPRYRGSDNLGGIQQAFYFLAVSEIERLPVLLKGIRSGAIQTVGGTKWHVGYATMETLLYQEPQTREHAGTIWSAELSGICPQDSELLRNLFEEMSLQKFVVIFRDSNGRTKIAGSLEEPLQFSYSPTTGDKVETLNAYSFRFHGPQTRAAAFLNAQFDTEDGAESGSASPGAGGSSSPALLNIWNGSSWVYWRMVPAGDSYNVPPVEVTDNGVTTKYNPGQSVAVPGLTARLASAPLGDIQSGLFSAGKMGMVVPDGVTLIQNYNNLSQPEKLTAYFGPGTGGGIADFMTLNYNCTAEMNGGVGVSPVFKAGVTIMKRNVRASDNVKNIKYTAVGELRPGGAQVFFTEGFSMNEGETLAVQYDKVNSALPSSLQLYGSGTPKSLSIQVGSFETQVERWRSEVPSVSNGYIIALNTLVSSWRTDGYINDILIFVPLAVESLLQCRNVMSNSYHPSFVNPPTLNNPCKYIQFDGATQYINTNVYPKSAKPTGWDLTSGIFGLRVTNDVATNNAIMGALGQSDLLSFGIVAKTTGGTPASRAYFASNSSYATTAPTGSAARHFAAYRDGTQMKLIVDGIASDTRTLAPSEYDVTKNVNFIAVGGRSASVSGMQDFNGSQQVAFYYFAKASLLTNIDKFYASLEAFKTAVNSL